MNTLRKLIADQEHAAFLFDGLEHPDATKARDKFCDALNDTLPAWERLLEEIEICALPGISGLARDNDAWANVETRLRAALKEVRDEH